MILFNDLIIAETHVASNQEHCAHRYAPVSFILPAQFASWTWSPAGFFPGCLDLLVGFFLRPVSPKSTGGHVSCSPHSDRKAATIYNLGVQFPIISRSASPLNPMRQKEKEAETNWLRSGCTLDRRHAANGIF